MKNFIQIIDNAFSDKLCDDLVQFYKDNESQMTLLDYSFDKNGEGANNVRTRQILLCNLNSEESSLIRRIQTSLQKVVAKYIETVDTFSAHIDEGLFLRKIHGATRNHTDGLYCADDNGKIFERKLSVIVGLNSDFEGGVFTFPFQDFQTTVKKGQAICFPPYYTHPHKVSEPTKGYRYTINTWLIEVPEGLNQYQDAFKNFKI